MNNPTVERSNFLKWHAAWLHSSGGASRAVAIGWIILSFGSHWPKSRVRPALNRRATFPKACGLAQQPAVLCAPSIGVRCDAVNQMHKRPAAPVTALGDRPDVTPLSPVSCGVQGERHPPLPARERGGGEGVWWYDSFHDHTPYPPPSPTPPAPYRRRLLPP